MSDSQAEEIIIQGIPASPGTVVGKAYIHKRVKPTVDRTGINKEMIPEQLALFQQAKQLLRDQWGALIRKESKGESKDILAAQIEILSDPELSERIEIHIKDGQKNAQRAIEKAFSNYIDLLSGAGNDLMADRMVDLTDIRDQLIEAASDHETTVDAVKGEILVAKEISPREVVQLSHQDIKGIVMERGGHSSHAAIIARSVGIPAVVGVKEATRKIQEDSTICVSGESGLVTINPSAKTCEQTEILAENTFRAEEEKQSICHRKSQTIDGHRFIIRANLEFPEELPHINEYEAEGIGLLRTESMFLDQQEFGSVEKQAAFYEQFVQKTDDEASVTIRLFDVGGDKLLDDEVVESNPFLGWRGIRMLLDKREVLRDQLKAILTVAARHPGRIKVLVPMVSAMNEIIEVKKEMKTCREQLAVEGIEVEEDLPIGVMVEVPNAAIHAAHFAEEADFFSIGTNDLTQYLLAVDRGNALISKLYDQRHPAVWHVIHSVIKAARERNKEVVVCGELASYPIAAACLVGMNISNLSMSPVSIPGVKKVLTERSWKEMQALAKQVLQCSELDDVRTLFHNWADNADE